MPAMTLAVYNLDACRLRAAEALPDHVATDIETGGRATTTIPKR